MQHVQMMDLSVSSWVYFASVISITSVLLLCRSACLPFDLRWPAEIHTYRFNCRFYDLF